MKKLSKVMLFAAMSGLFIPAAYAVCPVCVVSIGIMFELARLLGVDVVIVGIWAGGLTLSLFFWTASWLHRHNVKSVFWSIVVPFVLYYAMLWSVYLFPGVIKYGPEKMWGIDKFLLGGVVGSIAMYVGARWYNRIKAANGGHAQFPFQKVVMPLACLMLVTLVFFVITQFC